MKTENINTELSKFISANVGCDLVALAFKQNPFPDTDWQWILNQIAAKTKAKEKLPLWFKTPEIIFPSKLSVEQASSEITAEYKAGLVSGENLIDITGGFGVDAYYFSKTVGNVIHCEINSELSEIARHNFEVLKASNIKCHAGDGSDALKEMHTDFDWIYVDPSRRSDLKGKVFMLRDCLPDVPHNITTYFKHSKKILVKASPILDISMAISELKHVCKVHIIAVKNEVKELLFVLGKDYDGDIEIVCVNFAAETENFSFIFGKPISVHYDFPRQYLYEPNAAIMKSGGFDAVSNAFDVEKLNPNSHLMTSDEIVKFPGRIFEVLSIVPYNKSAKKLLLSIGKANVTVRNFPETVEVIRKKWKIADGGNQYCFFTTDKNDNKIVLICNKIK